MRIEFSWEVAEEFCKRISEGRSILSVCEDEDMPSRANVYRWMDDNPEFETKCTRARRDRADYRVKKMEEVVEKLERKEIDAHSANVILSQLRWTASKENPAIYGDKLNLSGEMTVNNKEIPDEKLDAKLQALLEKAKEK